MTGQMTLTDAMQNRFYDRRGRLVLVPEWVKDVRCGNCEYWQLLPKDEQPPEGWGVKGACGAHWSKGQHNTSQTSYCEEYKARQL